jgi:hypothetical protein
MHVILRDASIPHLARLEAVRPTRGDVFYLRLILKNCTSRSFVNARTVDEITYPTFQEAAITLGLFGEGNEALLAMEEAVTSLRTPREVRVLFIHLLIHDCVAAPLQLWQRFGNYMSLDFTLRNNGLVEMGMDEALQEMGHFLGEHGKSLDKYGLPQPVAHMEELTHELRRWAGRGEVLNEYADGLSALFNDEQLALYDAVLNAVTHQIPFRCFVDGKAGTGKTTVVRALCSKLRAARKIVLPTATSAFAAQLYEGGRTTHSTFKASFCDLILS